MNITINCRDV